MPVLRAVTKYRLHGKVRRIRLYDSWRNMLGRVRGGKSQNRTAWLGLPVEFACWHEFREWALAHGYSLCNNSLDRIRPSEGYYKHNLRWIPAKTNSARALTGRD